MLAVLSAFDPAFSARRKEVPKAYMPLRGYKWIKSLARVPKGSFGNPNKVKTLYIIRR